jgi:hypothetical protein
MVRKTFAEHVSDGTLQFPRHRKLLSEGEYALYRQGGLPALRKYLAIDHPRGPDDEVADLLEAVWHAMARLQVLGDISATVGPFASRSEAVAIEHTVFDEWERAVVNYKTAVAAADASTAIEHVPLPAYNLGPTLAQSWRAEAERERDELLARLRQDRGKLDPLVTTITKGREAHGDA